MFKTIVVGVDGREGGRDAISLASRLALVAGGELVALRVIPFDY
jgi:nucleotide-binding universal stress UspA family protein